MDYRMLLLKYIEHVTREESIDYISSGSRNPPDFITAQEWEELNRLSAEVRAKFVREHQEYIDRRK